MKENIIKIEGLKFSYEKGKEILKGIDVEIKKGEKIAVLGNNGSGKTTFFMNLNGVYLFDGGNIYLKGRKIGKNKKDLNYLRENIGIVFQNPDNQIIGSTVYEELSFGLINLGLSKKEVEERVEKISQKLNLKKYLDTPPHYLSGGEKKRVCIGDIVVMNPEIIIFDEPTSELDQLNIKILEGILNDLSMEKKTIILSTHDIDFAFRFADRILVFSDGEIIGDGTSEEIFKDTELLRKVNLKKPTVFEIYEELLRKNIIKNCENIPRTVDQLKKII